MKLIKILTESHKDIKNMMTKCSEGYVLSDDAVVNTIAKKIQAHDPAMPYKGAKEYAWDLWKMIYEIEERNIYEN